MSGHSKFANIKHKKEKNDAAKGKIFTIIGREIAVAVKEGGPDPSNNFKLAKVIEKDPAALNRYESAAILATHTGNTSVHSFAAEVEYHARFLIPIARFKIPLIGKSVYESAIRADMSVGDAEFQGPAPFYRADSRIVKRQYQCHKDKYL